MFIILWEYNRKNNKEKEKEKNHVDLSLRSAYHKLWLSSFWNDIWNCNFLLHKSCTEQPYTEEMEIFDRTQHRRHHLMFIEDPDNTNAYSFSSLSRSSTNIKRFPPNHVRFQHPPSVHLVLDLRRWKFRFLAQRASTHANIIVLLVLLQLFVEDQATP